MMAGRPARRVCPPLSTPPSVLAEAQTPERRACLTILKPNSENDDLRHALRTLCNRCGQVATETEMYQTIRGRRAHEPFCPGVDDLNGCAIELPRGWESRNRPFSNPAGGDCLHVGPGSLPIGSGGAYIDAKLAGRILTNRCDLRRRRSC